MKLTRQEAEDFLYHEVRLLDERRFEEWLDLFTPDGIYWIPIVDGSNPELEPSILYDDSGVRAQRVYQLLYQPHYAQRPPSRTAHLIGNVQVEQDGQDEALVRCTMVCHELREGDHRQYGLGRQRAMAGSCEYRLQYRDDRWRIALKKVLLLNRDLPIPNLSFIL